MLLDRGGNGKTKEKENNFKQKITTAEDQLSSSSATRFHKARNNLQVFLTVISKYTAQPLEKKKKGYKLTNLKHTSVCTSLGGSIWQCLMQKRCYATLFLLTTYLIKILHQLTLVGYKRCSFATLTLLPPRQPVHLDSLYFQQGSKLQVEQEKQGGINTSRVNTAARIPHRCCTKRRRQF